MPPLNIMGIVGSLRLASVNAATARAAATNSPDGMTITMHNIRDVPLFYGDLEDSGAPASIAALHQTVGAADGLLIFSPEYNSSFPAVTKNVIDWLTRPPKSWQGTPVAMVVTTPGARAGRGVRSHFSEIMGFQPIRLFETLGIGSYNDKVDADGELTDKESLVELSDYLARFAAFCRESE